MWIDDRILERCQEQVALDIWIPEQTCVVLGASNKAEDEVEMTFCQEAGIPILKRYGGGGTVVLYPGCVVISLGTWVKQDFQNAHYFRLINEAFIQELEIWLTPGRLSQDGLSDIVCDDRKLAGTSLFRSRNYLLYQASLLVDLDIDLVSRCLSHPTREPEYRIGRSHKQFLMGFSDLAKETTPLRIQHELRMGFAERLADVLGDELIPPVEAQFKNQLARAKRGREADQA